MNSTLKQRFLLIKFLNSYPCNSSYTIIRRSLNHSHLTRSEHKTNNSNDALKVKLFDENGNHTWVGPPDPSSNLRLKVFPTSEHLTQEETQFYKKSKEIQEWNQEYWASHNKDFEQSKKMYIEKKTNEKNLDPHSNLSTEEMAEFYKEFLNKNYSKHILYNGQWYKKNFELLYLSAKAQLSKVRKFIK